MTEIMTPRDAATLVLIRETSAGPKVLMGQRGRGAAFMPSKFVFPGGALDEADKGLAGGYTVAEHSHDRLRKQSDLDPAALALAAVRETWEETGLSLGADHGEAAARVADAPEDWRGFFAAGRLPATERLRFVFRAITPPARTRRFDARFFLAMSDAVADDLDDLSRASGELSHLSWLTLAEARDLDLPFVTEVVLAEVEARLKAPDKERPVPFFHHDDRRSYLDHL
ncbi:MAG: DNA mismatch repair protein MutT [Pseudomonadota bacterium]